MRLKHRIALTIFLLQTGLVLVVVGTLAQSAIQQTRAEAKMGEEVHLEHLLLMARAALLTEDYADLQTIAEEAQHHPRIAKVAVLDIDGRVVAATKPTRLGRPFGGFAEHQGGVSHDVVRLVEGHGQPLGRLAVRFTYAPLRDILVSSLARAMLVGVVGIAASAGVALVVGHLLARRLEDLASAASEVARGGPFNPSGPAAAAPEIEELSSAIRAMVEQLQRHAQELKAANDRLVVPTEAMAQGFALWDADDQLVLRNSRLAELFEVPVASLAPGLPFAHFADLVARAPSSTDPHAPVADRGELRRLKRRVRDLALADGRVLEVDETVTRDGGVVALYTDVTDARRSQAEVRRAASYDRLTGLANRFEVSRELATAIAATGACVNRVAVWFVDLDGFKVVNDTQGHRAGDALLVEAAGRLKAAISDIGTIGRLGGDEFLAVAPNVSDHVAVHLAQTMLASLRAPIRLGNVEFTVTASIGLAMITENGTSADELMQAADKALNEAKRRGGDRWRWFRGSMLVRLRHRASLSRELAKALERDELAVAYQPQYALQSGRLIGFEALLRWTNRSIGAVPPDQFIPVAEETGLIREIGTWMRQRAIADANAWAVDNADPPRIAINVSPLELRDGQYARSVLDVVTGRPGRIALELTERVLMDERGRGRRQLQVLSDAGLPLVLDDFGTGFSSLSHLRHFPISEIKIDRSFTADLIEDPADAQLVRALIKLAIDLGIDATAEGIETDAQLSWLRAAGCARGQGYLLAKPLPATDAAALVREMGSPSAKQLAALS